MVLSDVNGNGKNSAAERWLRQRNGQRVSAVRCIFGPPEKRAHLMVIMRNEAEMERKRKEFVARYEPVGLTPNERRKFYDGLVRTPSPGSHRQQHYDQHHNQYHNQNNDHNGVKKTKTDNHHRHHQQQQQQQQHKNSSFHNSDDEKN